MNVLCVYVFVSIMKDNGPKKEIMLLLLLLSVSVTMRTEKDRQTEDAKSCRKLYIQIVSV